MQNKTTKDTMCPDCNQVEITKQELGFRGKCLSCYRREVAARRHSKEYIKFKDLPIDKQQEIIYTRATLKMNRKTNNLNLNSLQPKLADKKMSKKKGKSKYDDIKELHTYIKQNSDKTIRQIMMYAIKNINGCEKLSASTLKAIIDKNGYKYLSREDIYNRNKTKIKTRQQKSHGRTKTYSIY